MSDNEKPDVIEPHYVAFTGDTLADVLQRAANWTKQNSPVPFEYGSVGMPMAIANTAYVNWGPPRYIIGIAFQSLRSEELQCR